MSRRTDTSPGIDDTGTAYWGGVGAVPRRLGSRPVTIRDVGATLSDRDAGLYATVIALAFMGFIVIGVSHPEPAASAALGPDWHCSRLAFVFTTCSRFKDSRLTAVRLAKIPVCGRLRT